MIKYLQLPYSFDIAKLQQDVFAIPNESWQLHYQKLHYEGDWSGIPLRSIGGNADNLFISPVNNAAYEDTSFLQHANYIKEVLSNFKCPLQSVRLLRLNAGAVIKEHRDGELSYEHGAIRLHIPVVTNDKVEFYLDKERIHLSEGECWYMNFNLPHSIINNSEHNRVHLVIDALVNDWVKEMFNQPSAYKKEIEEPGYDAVTKRKIIEELREMDTETSNNLADELESSN